MGDSLDSVHGIISSLRNRAKQCSESGQGDQASTLESQASSLEALITEIKQLRAKLAPLPSRLGDLSDIPEELRAELSGIEIDELEGKLLAVINAHGGTADLNQILVGLFRRFNIVQKRRFIQQKLWRMTTDGLIWSVPKRKGVYTTKRPLGAGGEPRAGSGPSQATSA